MKTWNRRQILQAGLVSTATTLFPAKELFAQSSSTSLLRASKEALIIGNSKYRSAPLKNPANDANDMAEELKKAGFAVTLGFEMTRAEMQSAIASYAKRLAVSRAVGLFYFAGHGAQLAWRNYLIPVDGEIGSVEELRERGVDLNGLIEGIRRAGNPMNLIVLDACRDNPFGGAAHIEQKGLSQLDAPPGTFLAYATAPGNTAIDGEGRNGLYTEHLLQEIKVPEAKVEDVFKRVRLAVRRRSKGMQIPWESTSLEEDFWFVPPKELKKLADAEIEREYREELAVWERAQKATAPGPIEDYLRRYPSGRFSELAQSQLDRVLAKLGETKVEIVSAPQNPYSKGTIATNTAYKIGDSYSYRRLDVLTKLEAGKPYTERVSKILDDEVIFSDGNVMDSLGNWRKWGGQIWAGSQTVPVEFSVGKRWRTRFERKISETNQGVMDLGLHIADRELVSVPAGKFNAFRIEARGYYNPVGGLAPVAWDWKIWYAPDQVRQPVALEWFNRITTYRYITFAERRELTDFAQS